MANRLLNPRPGDTVVNVGSSYMKVIFNEYFPTEDVRIVLHEVYMDQHTGHVYRVIIDGNIAATGKVKPAVGILLDTAAATATTLAIANAGGTAINDSYELDPGEDAVTAIVAIAYPGRNFSADEFPYLP